jgi:hypothetical protein
MTPEKQQERVENADNKFKENAINDAIANAREIDDKLRLRTDIFNAKTVAIVELKKAIDNDPTIENKPYAFAQELSRRFDKMKEIIFKANAEIVDAVNEQKALQIQLNQMANQLRAEEREKLKIQDINYNPHKAKTVSVTKIKTQSKKFDKVELRRLASELGMPESTIQMLAVAKGLSLDQVGNLLRRTVNEAKSESPNKTEAIS